MRRGRASKVPFYRCSGLGGRRCPIGGGEAHKGGYVDYDRVLRLGIAAVWHGVVVLFA
jgi:hypothetical protein